MGDDLEWGSALLLAAVMIIGPLMGLLLFVTGLRRQQRNSIAIESLCPSPVQPPGTKADNGTRVLVVIVLLSLFCLYRNLFSH